MQQHVIAISVSIAFTVIAAFLWWHSVTDSRASRTAVGGAVATAVIAAFLWALLWAVRAREKAEQRRARDDADKSLLIRKLAADAVPAQAQPLTQTLPLRRPFHRVR